MKYKIDFIEDPSAFSKDEMNSLIGGSCLVKVTCSHKESKNKKKADKKELEGADEESECGIIDFFKNHFIEKDNNSFCFIVYDS